MGHMKVNKENWTCIHTCVCMRVCVNQRNCKIWTVCIIQEKTYKIKFWDYLIKETGILRKWKACWFSGTLLRCKIFFSLVSLILLEMEIFKENAQFNEM
jgi:hypothetical protein